MDVDWIQLTQDREIGTSGELADNMTTLNCFFTKRSFSIQYLFCEFLLASLQIELPWGIGDSRLLSAPLLSLFQIYKLSLKLIYNFLCYLMLGIYTKICWANFILIRIYIT
jgi:hypothetical protein